MSATIRVLLLSYFFPPTPLAEACVTAKTMGATGYPTDVLCVDSRTWNLPADKVVGRYAGERFGAIVRKRLPGGRTLLRIQWRVPLVCDVPDAMLYLWPAARRSALAMFDGHDVLVTRSQLHSVHLAGLAVKRRHPQLPWVASLSDPWTGSYAPDRNAVTRFVNTRMEAAVLQKCDLAVFTSEQAADYTMRRHPRISTPVRVVPHSFDPVLYGDPPGPGPDRIVLRYCGYFDSARTPEPLLRAAGRLLERRPELAASMRVELVGGAPKGALDTPAGRALPPGFVTTREPVDYCESLQLMQTASALLVIDADASKPAAGTYLPSKLIDYIGAARPIVAFSPPGAAAQVVTDLGGAVASPDDPDAGATALERVLDDAARRDGAWGAPEVRDRFHVRCVGDMWRSILDEVTGAARPTGASAAHPSRLLAGLRHSVGVRLDPARLSAWAASVVDQVAEVADVVRIDVPSVHGPAPAALGARFVDRFLTGERPTATKKVTAIRALEPDDGRRLDVVVDLVGDGVAAPTRAVFGTLVFGIDGRHGNELPPGRDRCVRRSLDVLRADGTWASAGEAVQRRDPVSRARALDAALWSSPGLLRAAIARLSHDGTLESPRPRVSSSGRMVPLPIEVLRSTWRRATASDARERWHLVVRSPAPAAGSPVTAAEAASAVAPAGRSWADPFLIELEGTKHVLFEDVAAGGRGQIAIAAIGTGGRLGPARTVLKRPYHVSYPFVIQRDGRTFMVPESGENRTVDLYELVGSPPQAVHEATLLAGITAQDPTIVEAGERLRLFVFVVTDGRAGGELHLFSADALAGPWESHPRNPVVTDARTARPAGGLLVIEGRLVRPAQTTIPSYGAHVTLHEVVELSDDRYEERPWKALHSNLLGQHHLHRMGDVEVLDVLRRDSIARHLRPVRPRGGQR